MKLTPEILTKNKNYSEIFYQKIDQLENQILDGKTFDEITSIMFQLYCGNDYGMGNFSLSFIDKAEQAWQKGRKQIAKNQGLSLVKNV